MEKMGYARGLSSPSLLTLDRFPEIRRTRLTGFLTSAERSRQTPVKMTISAAIPTGAAEALYQPPKNLTPGDSQTALDVSRCRKSLIRGGQHGVG
jgi:hypothetical protein